MAMLRDYKCNSCGAEFESFESVCKCGSSDLKRIITKSNVALSDGRLSSKVPNGFKTLLNEMHKTHGKHSNINTMGVGEI
jgi:hypothetical protein